MREGVKMFECEREWKFDLAAPTIAGGEVGVEEEGRRESFREVILSL